MRRKLLAVWTVLVIGFLYVPMAPVIVGSFNKSKLNLAWTGFTWEWYRVMWLDRGIREAAMNSIVIALIVTVLSVVLGTAGAWAIYRYRFAGMKLLTTLVVTPLVLPEVIMGISLLMFLVVARQVSSFFELGLGKTTVVIGHTTFCFPFVLVAVHARLVGMDPSMEEAAMDLGATPLLAFRKVIVPYLMPAIVAGALMAFTLSMDELIVTYFLSGPGSATLPVKIFGMARVGLSPVLNAVSTLFIVGTAIMVIAGAYIQRIGAVERSR